MKVEIFSDVMCPFCYMGKRKFEMALEQFSGKEKVEVIWRSYQLNPMIKTDPSMRIDEYLSKEKGISRERATEMNNYVKEAGEKVGLTYNFEKVVVANSFKAHRFLHFAASKGKQNEAGEKLFKAYFTDGANTDDNEVLIKIGVEAGLDALEIITMLNGNDFSPEVENDLQESRMFGVTGVPFFIFNRKYAVSGAQEPAVFLEILEKVEAEIEESQPLGN